MMKKILITIISILCSSYHLLAQKNEYSERNNERLKEINQRIDENVAIKNYENAANLQKEEAIRAKLEKSYKNNESTEKILQYKSQLINCNCTPKSLNREMEMLKEEINEWNKKTAYKSENFVLYTDFLVANFVSTATDYYGQIPFYSYYNSGRQYNGYFGLGFKIGSSFFFKDLKEGQKFRIGFDLTYFSFMVGISTGFGFEIPSPEMIVLNLPQPGLVLSEQFNNHSGFEFRANVGLTKSFGFDLTGMSGRAAVKYWINQFAVGIDYQYSTSMFNAPINSDRIHQVGLSIGMRF